MTRKNLTINHLQVTNMNNKQLGIFATIGLVFRTACSVLVKACTQSESIMDISQDLIDTGKAHSSNFKQTSILELNAQLADAESTLNANS